jgi:hypothetical protein
MNAKSVKFSILILEVLKKKIQVIPVILVVPPLLDGMGFLEHGLKKDYQKVMILSHLRWTFMGRITGKNITLLGM